MMVVRGRFCVQGRRRLYFNGFRFIFWTVEGIVYSFIIFYLLQVLFADGETRCGSTSGAHGVEFFRDYFEANQGRACIALHFLAVYPGAPCCPHVFFYLGTPL